MEQFYNLIKRANHELKPHQEAGVRWCVNSERQGVQVTDQLVRGGFVADEMGLGKTIQMIGTCVCNPKRRTLIVLPRSLLEQWEAIIQTTLHHQPIVFHGYRKRGVTVHDLDAAPFVITTYGMLAEPDKDKNLLQQIVWERVIFDEAHHLRNKQTAAHKGALALSATIRWLVTGTPIQNKRADLCSLCHILELPTVPDDINRIMLRRTKAEAGIILPPLDTSLCNIEWTSEEQAVCDSIESEYEIVRILRARQACVYPALVGNAITQTSKITNVIDMLVARQSNTKSKLVFCQFRREIDKIKAELLERGFTKVVVFDGRVKQSERTTIMSSTCEVLLCQIQTCCEGLNLQQFSEIYFVGPHWNPAVEDQAVARCHRIGQTQKVDVFRFFMVESIETHVQQTQDLKRTLASEVMVDKKRL